MFISFQLILFLWMVVISFLDSFKILNGIQKLNAAMCKKFYIKMNSFESNTGLLTDIDDVTKSKYYSNSIDIQKGFLNSYIYQAALSDVNNNELQCGEYLNDIAKNSYEFIISNTLSGKEQLKSEFKNFLKNKGTLACLLGGKSTGKSFFLQDFGSHNSDTSIVVNLQENSNILECLTSSLRSNVAIYQEILEGNDFPMSMNSSDIQKLKFLILSFVRVCEMKNKNAILIIDEANLGLKIDETTSAIKIKKVKSILALFSTLTKQQKKVGLLNFSFRLLLLLIVI